MQEKDVEKKIVRVDRSYHMPIERKFPKIGRNEMCPCGSGKKFKNCHWHKRYKGI